MSTPCNNYVVPVFQQDECLGERIKAQCVVDSSLYSELSLSANATQQQINQAIYTSYVNLKGMIDSLQEQINILEGRIVTLETI